MDGNEVVATLMCSTSDCPVCECPKDELDRTELFYPLGVLRNTNNVKAAVCDASKEMLEEHGTVKIPLSCISYDTKVSHTISTYCIAYDIASIRYCIRYPIRYRLSRRLGFRFDSWHSKR